MESTRAKYANEASSKPTSLAQSRQRPLREMTRPGVYDSKLIRTRATTVKMERSEVRTRPSSTQSDKSKSLRREVHCHPSLSRHWTSAIGCGPGWYLWPYMAWTNNTAAASERPFTHSALLLTLITPVGMRAVSGFSI